MKKLIEIFNKLSAYDHFTIFLLILTIIKFVHTLSTQGTKEGILLLSALCVLIIISGVIFFVFRKITQKEKGWQNAFISTIILFLILGHDNMNILTGVILLFLLYSTKFFIQIKRKSIFNPVAFSVVGVTLISFFLPSIIQPDLNWGGFDLRFNLFGFDFPLPLIPIFLSIIFNVKRIKRRPLTLSFAFTVIPFWIFLFPSTDITFILLVSFFLGGAILVEPKTSPVKTNEQIILGVSTGLVLIFLLYIEIPNSELFAICIANIGYFSFRELRANHIASKTSVSYSR